MDSNIILYTRCDEQEALHRMARAANLIAVYWFLPPGSRPLLIRFYRNRLEVYKRRYASRFLLGPTVFRGQMEGRGTGTIIRGGFSVAWFFRLLSAAWLIAAWLLLAGFIWLFLDGVFLHRAFPLLLVPLAFLLVGLVIGALNRRRSIEERKFILRYLEWALQAHLVLEGSASNLLLVQGEMVFSAAGQDSQTAVSSFVMPRDVYQMPGTSRNGTSRAYSA